MPRNLPRNCVGFAALVLFAGVQSVQCADPAESEEAFLKGRALLDQAESGLNADPPKAAESRKSAESAAALFEAAFKSATPKTEDLLLLGRAHALAGADDRAEAAWRKGLADNPKHAPTLRELARLLTTRSLANMLASSDSPPEIRRARFQKQAGEAAEMIGVAAAGGGGFPRAVGEALMAYADAEPAKLRRITAEALKEHSSGDGAEFVHLLAGLAADEADKLNCYDRAVSARPGFALTRLFRGQARHNAGNTGGALSEYDLALALNPRLTPALINRAAALESKGDSAGALADFAEAFRIDPTQTAALMGRARVLLNTGKPTEALAAYSDALRINPSHANALIGRGNARYVLRDLEGARADYEEALRLDPISPEAWVNRGNVRKDLGDVQGALADYDEALKHNPRKVQALIGRAAAKSTLGDPAGMIEDLSAALAIDPTCADAYVKRSVARTALGQAREALSDVTEAIRINPRQADAYVIRGNLRAAAGDMTGAGEDYSRALEAAPSGWPLRKKIEQLRDQASRMSK